MKSDERYARFIAECCEALEVSVEDVLGRSREAGPVMMARFLLTHVLRKTYGLSYPQLARLLKRDHTTCIHADRKFAALIESGDRHAKAALALVAAMNRPLQGIEGPLDSLRYCGAEGPAIELAEAGA